MRQLDQSAAGAPGPHVCHAATTSSASDHGHDREKAVIPARGWEENVNDVTTPKLPPPAPRSAQKRSGSFAASHVTMRPSASTTVADRSESHVRPNRRPTTPWPPPSVSPLMPTVGHVPTGITAPVAATPAATSITFAPAPIVAVPADVRTLAIGETSITIPSESEYPP